MVTKKTVKKSSGTSKAKQGAIARTVDPKTGVETVAIDARNRSQQPLNYYLVGNDRPVDRVDVLHGTGAAWRAARDLGYADLALFLEAVHRVSKAAIFAYGIHGAWAEEEATLEIPLKWAKPYLNPDRRQGGEYGTDPPVDRDRILDRADLVRALRASGLWALTPLPSGVNVPRAFITQAQKTAWLAKWCWFNGSPERIVRGVLHHLTPHFERIFGRALPHDAREKVVKAIERVRARSDADRRQVENYVSAVLRACGVPERTAETAAKADVKVPLKKIP
jgi:hypothetical protein